MYGIDAQTYLDRLGALETHFSVTLTGEVTALDRLATVEQAAGITYPITISGVTYSLPITLLDRLFACEGKAT